MEDAVEMHVCAQMLRDGLMFSDLPHRSVTMEGGIGLPKGRRRCLVLCANAD